jgi:fucose permease
MLLALLTTLAFFSEGAMENWSAIHLRSTLGGSAVLGAAGVAVFHGAMLIGRLAAAGVLARVSRLAVLRGAGVATAAGMLVALATTSPVVTLAGLLCVGLALSAVAPICFSLAGDAAPQARGSASALITTVGYTGFLVGPVLIGWVAELTTLRIALGAVVLAGVLVAVSTSRLAGSTTTTAAAPP